MIWYSFHKRITGSIWFKGFAYGIENELLEYVFSTSSTDDYDNWYEALQEIEDVLTGKIETSEPMILRDAAGDSGGIYIYKDITILEIKEEGKRLELPTEEYKQLMKDWIKFIEINTKAFIEG